MPETRPSRYLILEKKNYGFLLLFSRPIRYKKTLSCIGLHFHHLGGCTYGGGKKPWTMLGRMYMGHLFVLSR